MLPSKPRKPIRPPGRPVRRSQAERDALAAAELRRTTAQRAENEKFQEQVKLQKRVQSKIQRAEAHGVRKWELQEWELARLPIEQIQRKTCTQCSEFGWNRFWCPNCSCFICQDLEHIAADCPGLKDSPFADKLEAIEEHQEAGVKSTTDWRSRQWSSSGLFVSIPAPGPKDPVSMKPLPFEDWPVRFPQDPNHESTLELC
jgi:hypothetical protein